MRILFTGGGTGGHVYPIISIAREIRRIYPGSEKVELFYAGAKNEFASILLSQENLKVKTLSSGKIRRYFSFKNITDILFKIPWGVLQAFFYLWRVKPEVIFSKGGHGSFPITFWAKFFNIPVYIHESDIVPGWANRIAAKNAEKIFVSFEKTEYFSLDRVIVTGNPIRREILEGSEQGAKETFDLTMEKPIILFMGGSQGAQKINDFVLIILNNLLEDFEVIHQCGSGNFKQVKREAGVIIKNDLIKYYHVHDFLKETKLKHALKIADIVVSRAGSGSVFELAATGKPSILVPLPSAAANHQSKNAYAYSNKGACLIIEQQNLKPNFFLEKLNQLFSNPEKREQMSQKAIEFSKPQAAKKIARQILEEIIYLPE